MLIVPKKQQKYAPFISLKRLQWNLVISQCAVQCSLFSVLGILHEEANSCFYQDGNLHSVQQASIEAGSLTANTSFYFLPFFFFRHNFQSLVSLNTHFFSFVNKVLLWVINRIFFTEMCI